MAEVVITYETLYELLRREKSREELQKLEENFLQETQKYLQEKGDIIKKAGESLFANDERRKTQTQIENARRLLKELYHKREQKIVNTALDTNKTGTKIVSTANMLPREKELYKNVLTMLESSKSAMLNAVLEGSLKPLEPEENSTVEKEKQETPNSGDLEGGKPKDLKGNLENGKSVRFKEEVPKFMGTDLNVYGPYDKETEATLPEKVAELLIKKGKVEEI